MGLQAERFGAWSPGAINEIKPAAEIVEDMVGELISTLHMLGNVGAQVPQEASARL